MSDYTLAVCSEMVFTDLPINDRIRRIDEMGFAAEIWSWHDKDLQALADTGARFSSMTGYLHGDLIDPATADEVVRTAELSIKAAETLGVPRGRRPLGFEAVLQLLERGALGLRHKLAHEQPRSDADSDEQAEGSGRAQCRVQHREQERDQRIGGDRPSVNGLPVWSRSSIATPDNSEFRTRPPCRSRRTRCGSSSAVVRRLSPRAVPPRPSSQAAPQCVGAPT